MIKSTIWKNFYHFDSLGSTNTKAEEMISRGISSGIVLADEQTEGKGRLDRSWYSQKGNIFVSFFAVAPDSGTITASSIAAAESVYETAALYINDTQLFLKWPNDLLAGNNPMRKCSGILGKAVSNGRRNFYIIGIGLNIITPDKKLKYTWPPASLQEISGKELERNDVLVNLVTAMERNFTLEKAQLYEKALARFSWMAGRKIYFSENLKDYFNGIIKGFSPDCSLMTIEKSDGAVIEVSTVSIERID